MLFDGPFNTIGIDVHALTTRLLNFFYPLEAPS